MYFSIARAQVDPSGCRILPRHQYPPSRRCPELDPGPNRIDLRPAAHRRLRWTLSSWRPRTIGGMGDPDLNYRPHPLTHRWSWWDGEVHSPHGLSTWATLDAISWVTTLDKLRLPAGPPGAVFDALMDYTARGFATPSDRGGLDLVDNPATPDFLTRTGTTRLRIPYSSPGLMFIGTTSCRTRPNLTGSFARAALGRVGHWW